MSAAESGAAEMPVYAVARQCRRGESYRQPDWYTESFMWDAVIHSLSECAVELSLVERALVGRPRAAMKEGR